MGPADALIVDDDADGREALAQVLISNGYTVRQAENGRAALDMIAERVPGVLVLDLEMPVMNGWEVLASLAHGTVLPATTIVVVSADAAPPPGLAFVRKPCGIDELLVVVRAASRPQEACTPCQDGA